jgi:hypothetical protein
VAPEVAGSIPVSHPGMPGEKGRSECRLETSGRRGRGRCQAGSVQRSVAQVVEHRSPKPGVAGSSPAGPVRFELEVPVALSSRGLGRGPLKAQTRVRIPLALYRDEVGPIVYRLGRDPFKVERGVRLPLGLWTLPAPLAQLAEQVTLNH